MVRPAREWEIFRSLKISRDGFRSGTFLVSRDPFCAPKKPKKCAEIEQLAARAAAGFVSGGARQLGKKIKPCAERGILTARGSRTLEFFDRERFAFPLTTGRRIS